MERRGRRCKQLLNGLKETRGHRKVKGAALDRTLWRTRFLRGYGPVVRETMELIKESLRINVAGFSRDRVPGNIQ
jgi:hypothetical protein